jgi:hypothetical protein
MDKCKPIEQRIKETDELLGTVNSFIENQKRCESQNIQPVLSEKKNIQQTPAPPRRPKLEPVSTSAPPKLEPVSTSAPPRRPKLEPVSTKKAPSQLGPIPPYPPPAPPTKKKEKQTWNRNCGKTIKKDSYLFKSECRDRGFTGGGGRRRTKRRKRRKSKRRKSKRRKTKRRKSKRRKTKRRRKR